MYEMEGPGAVSLDPVTSCPVTSSGWTTTVSGHRAGPPRFPGGLRRHQGGLPDRGLLPGRCWPRRLRDRSRTGSLLQWWM